MSEEALAERGMRIAGLLHQCWRAEPPPLPCPLPRREDLLPPLLSTGCGPLLWRRIRASKMAHEPDLGELRSAYRMAALRVAVHEAEIAQVVAPLRDLGLRFLLIKGWAAARLYPEAALRPYGDIDLLFHPEDLAQAESRLRCLDFTGTEVELHAAGEGAYQVLPAAEWTAAIRRAESVEVGGVPVRIPRPEDHLRALAFHFAVHGGWRPLWLCDLAAGVEHSHATLDWQLLLRGSRFQRDWILTTLLLARDLLGADLALAPAEVRKGVSPPWVRETVLAQWGLGTGPSRREALSEEYLRFLRTPSRIWGEIRAHWPNRVQACLETGTGPGTILPRMAQCRAVTSRLPRLLRRATS